jgi:hypothetical protein
MFLFEFHDPHISKSIWIEDHLYIPQVYAAILLSFVLPLAGIQLRRFFLSKKPS